MSSRRRRPAFAAAALLGALLAAPAAYASWTNGAGTGTAATASPQPVKIAPGTAGSRALYPTGQPIGDVAVAITNPNAFRVRVAALVLDTAAGSGGFSANAAGCGLAFSPATDGWDIPAGATVQLDLQGSIAMAPSAPPTCQGLAVQVHLRAAP
jgi:hypothetical protein